MKELNDWENNRNLEAEKVSLPTNNAEIKSIFSIGKSSKGVIKGARKSASEAGGKEEEKRSPGRESFDFYKKEGDSSGTSRSKVLAEKELRKRE